MMNEFLWFDLNLVATVKIWAENTAVLRNKWIIINFRKSNLHFIN